MSNISINKNTPAADLIAEMGARLAALTAARDAAIAECKSIVSEFGLTPAMILPELETTVPAQETPQQAANASTLDDAQPEQSIDASAPV